MNYLPFFVGIVWAVSPIGLPLSIAFCAFSSACVINKKCSLSPIFSLILIFLFLPLNFLIKLQPYEKGIFASIFLLACNLILLKKDTSSFFATVLLGLTFIVGFLPNTDSVSFISAESYIYSAGVCISFVLWYLIFYFLSKDFNCEKIKKPSIYLSFCLSAFLPFFV